MSNLIKSVYFNVDNEKVRTIDSDEKVEEYIPDIFKKDEEVQEYDFVPLTGAETFLDGDNQDEFDKGVSVISMDDVRGEQREIVYEQINEEKERILQEAKDEAEQLIESARKEAEAIREAAHQEGLIQGREEGRVDASKELEEIKSNLQDEYAGKMEQLENEEKNLEPAFAEIVVSLVKKLTGISCENKRDVILYLIGNSLKNIDKTKRIVLRVSKQDIPVVSSKKATLQMIAKNISEFEITEDSSLSENQCIIETDDKIIDCSLDAQLKNLEEHVKLLAN